MIRIAFAQPRGRCGMARPKDPCVTSELHGDATWCTRADQRQMSSAQTGASQSAAAEAECGSTTRIASILRDKASRTQTASEVHYLPFAPHSLHANSERIFIAIGRMPPTDLPHLPVTGPRPGLCHTSLQRTGAPSGEMFAGAWARLRHALWVCLLYMHV